MSLIIPANEEPAQPEALLPFNCTMCRHHNHLPFQPPREGYCLRYPPTVLMVGLQPPRIAGGAPTPVTLPVFPQTGPLCVCGEFSAKAEAVQ